MLWVECGKMLKSIGVLCATLFVISPFAGAVNTFSNPLKATVGSAFMVYDTGQESRLPSPRIMYQHYYLAT
ncbi:hypothetical protein JB92DRAFT_3006505 [Gautieria morchelliformis]|nr:hypothetical protein JB92DRAFT_3006505 [Gautieria morchelliformis]